MGAWPWNKRKKGVDPDEDNLDDFSREPFTNVEPVDDETTDKIDEQLEDDGSIDSPTWISR